MLCFAVSPLAASTKNPVQNFDLALRADALTLEPRLDHINQLQNRNAVTYARASKIERRFTIIVCKTFTQALLTAYETW